MRFETYEEAVARGVAVTVCPTLFTGSTVERRYGQIAKARNTNGNDKHPLVSGQINTPGGRISFFSEKLDRVPQRGERVSFHTTTDAHGALKAIGVKLEGEK